MQYAKVVNGALQYAPRKIKEGDTTTYNPTAAMLAERGFKPIVDEERPEVEEGYYLAPVYTETENSIIRSWAEVPDPYYNNASPEEIEEALEGIL